MAKYEFKTIGIDQFELHYEKDGKDVCRPFKRTIELAKRMQSLDATARFNMLSYLNSIGKTKNDLIVERKNADGTTSVDESNYREFESAFLLEERYKLANDIYKITFGVDLVTLVQEIGFQDDHSALLFSTKLRMILTGENTGENSNENPFPSGNAVEQVSTKDTK